MKNNVCPFCEEEKNRTCSLIGKDRTVFETSNFRVFPTVGGFVENYQLIVPKRHINCFGVNGNIRMYKKWNIKMYRNVHR